MIEIKSISDIMTTPCVFVKQDLLDYILESLEAVVETKDDLKRVQECVSRIAKAVGENEECNEFWNRVSSSIKADDSRDFAFQLASVKNLLIKANQKGFIELDKENKIVCNGRYRKKDLAVLTAVGLGYLDAYTGKLDLQKSLNDEFCSCLFESGKSVRSAYSDLKHNGEVIDKNSKDYDYLLRVQDIMSN